MRTLSFVPHNEVKLLHCGTDYFPALIAAIDNARYDVFFETYIFAADDIGTAVQAALVRAAERGVHVRMVTDWFGTGHKRVTQMDVELAQAGVRHRVFNPWFKRGLTRSHRKLCVVDRQVAFVGGINVTDDLFCEHHPGVQLAAPRWDFAVQLRGPLVAQIHTEMQAQWARTGHLNFVKRVKLFRDLRKVDKVQAENPMLAAFVVRDNWRNRRTIQRAYLQAIGRARRSVLLANPYFAPGHKVRKALASAALRGVEVKLLIGVGEFYLQDAVAHSFYPRLLAAGVQVIEYHKTQLHAKVAVVDEEWATVGSSNFDALSLFVNQEANVVVKDAGFAASLRAHIERAMAEGEQIRREEFAHVGWVRRLGYRVAYTCYKLTARVFGFGYA